ncbi:gamma carbonic anhydrase family protein [Leucobacter sp. CSA2]|uniref:Gamma carbonic anhydrase family protein n=1 Tax=Leucobacter edaphi TaxID=2796472 RepID=A0A934QAV0_9MICO|nr:gamma carbonic anhydrase family protein [Leucobacter edaphi]MBK0421319.1 gamma carbonic anhydrase family protein [Leucobacter edaphi]
MTSESWTERTPHGGLVIALDLRGTPRVDPSAWIGPGAIVVGDVAIGAGSSVWYNAVVRGDSDSVRIGERTNLQDGVVVHTQRGDAAVIGDDVSVGHNAVVHGATIERGCLIGMGSTILSGAVIGEGSLVAAGALVPQGAVIPPRSLVAGIPGRVVRELREDDRAAVRRNAELYAGYTERHRDATRGLGAPDSA